MPTVQVPAQLTVDHLLGAVRQLSPAELQPFVQRFTEWQQQNGALVDEEAALVRATKERLPAADERRLKQLIRKSERGTLSSKERDEYRALAQQAEQFSVRRVEALAQLVQRWGKPAHAVRQEIGWESGNDDA